jgi:hypothetical protein
MRTKGTLFVIVATLLYVLSYGYFRSTGALVHFQNRSLAQGDEIKATPEEWAEVDAAMAQRSRVHQADASWSEIKPKILNGIFWPPRKTEELYWKMRRNMSDQTIRTTPDNAARSTL